MSKSYDLSLIEGVSSSLSKDTGCYTRYAVSPYDLIYCKKIMIANWTGVPNISLGNMNEVIARISASGNNSWVSTRDWEPGEDYNKIPFEFDGKMTKDMVYNLIIYISKEDNQPVGYTKLPQSQSFEGYSIGTLLVFLNFDIKFEQGDFGLKNSLQVHIENVNFQGNLDKNGVGYDYLYPKKSSILTDPVDCYPRYSNYIHHMYKDPSIMTINCNKIITNSYVGRMKLNPVTVTYHNIKVCLFNKDLVLVEWDDDNYKITSMTILDSNGRNYVYHRGVCTNEIKEVGTITDATPTHIICHTPDKYLNGEISRIAGENIVYSYRDSNKLLKDGDKVKFIYNPYLERPGFIVDNREDITYSVQVSRDVENYDDLLPSRIKSEEFLRHINSVVTHTASDSKATLVTNDNYNRDIVGFVGTFIIKEVGTDYLKYINLEGIIGVRKDSKIIIVNDNCIMEKLTDRLVFYFTDNGSLIPYPGEVTNRNDSSRLKYEVMMTDTRNQVLDGFRRNPITYNSIPDIVAAFGGLLFYVDTNNQLRYL